MITNSNWEKQTITYDLGYSDHLAQVAHIKLEKQALGPKTIEKRHFTENAIEEFIPFLQKETWDQVLLLEDVNKSFNAFMTTFMCHFNTLFPTKTFSLNNKKKNKWMTKGLIVSRNRLRTLNRLKRTTRFQGSSYIT